MSIWLGVDPGASGGIGVIRDSFDKGLIAEAFKMPATEMDLCELLESLCSTEDTINYIKTGRREVFCYLEKAQAFPGSQKVTKCPRCSIVLKTRQSQGVSSTFKFGMQYGTLKGILTALHIPFELIRPVDWQRALGCMTKGDKNISKNKAQQLFPDIKVTHAKADALLLSEYCRRMRSNDYQTNAARNKVLDESRTDGRSR